MCRIDVVNGEKGKFKVLVNFIQRGVPYSTQQVANTQAKCIQNNELHNAELHLMRSNTDVNAL